MRRSRGFTLIELLVVVAVLAVLIGLLLPALAGAREAGRAAKCLSNQRQIGVALMLYANQYDEWVPREGFTTGIDDPRNRLPWASALRPFLDDDAMPNEELDDLFAGAEHYRCPSRPPDQHNIHYVVNGFSFLGPGQVDPRGFVEPRTRKGPTRLSRMLFTDQTLYLTSFAADPDGTMYAYFTRSLSFGDLSLAQYYDAYGLSHLNSTPTAPPVRRQRIEPMRHRDGANALFLDGHAKGLKARQLQDINAWDDRDYRVR